LLDIYIDKQPISNIEELDEEECLFFLYDYDYAGGTVTMTTICKFLILAVLMVATSTVSAVQITSMLGDNDGFGLGLLEGDTRAPSLGNFDTRAPGDPLFTDHAPVVDVSYTQFLGAGFSSINSAEIQFFSLGIQDGDSQVFQSDIDLRLFLDGVELLGAFDIVDQFDFLGGAFVEIAGLVTITIPNTMFGLLLDGSVDVQIENLQLNPNAVSSGDSFALDFSRFNLDVELNATTVPEPATFFLLLAGLSIFGLRKLKYISKYAILGVRV